MERMRERGRRKGETESKVMDKRRVRKRAGDVEIERGRRRGSKKQAEGAINKAREANRLRELLREIEREQGRE